MNRLSLLTTAALAATGAASDKMPPELNKYALSAFGTFFKSFEDAWAAEEVKKFPSCVDNAAAYLTAYSTSCTGTSADCSSNSAEDRDVCCDGMTPWPNKQEGCENYDGDKQCCMECVDTSYPGYEFECTMDSGRIVGGIKCDANPLAAAMAPLPAGVYCDPEPLVITGSYMDDNDMSQQAPNCDFLLEAVFEGATGYDMLISPSPELEALSNADAIVFRPVLVGGDVQVTVNSQCNIILSAHVNGMFAMNPTNATPAVDMSPELMMYNTTFYGPHTVNLNQGIYIIIGAKNDGAILKIDTPDIVKMTNISNHNSGVIQVHNSMDLFMHNISNDAMFSVHNVDAVIQTVVNHQQGNIEFDGGIVMATNMTNEGNILVKSGTYCVLELYKNYGIITIESGATCEVYLNVNEHTGFGTLNIPPTGVTVIQGNYGYAPYVELPMAEAFGKWTTGAYRAGKSRWVGDKAIDHGNCDQFRFNTLGIRSIVQSPSNDTFNAVLEISHLKRQMHVDMSYINITVRDMTGQPWVFSRYLFDDSDVITHLDPPEPDASGIVHSSTKNFKVVVSIDFEFLDIPKSMQNHVEIVVFSLRQGQTELKMDAMDCVQLHDVGVVNFDE